MKNFEEAIAPFIKKIETKDPHMPQIKLTTPRKTKNIHISKVKDVGVAQHLPPGCSKERSAAGVKRKIHTPTGIYDSVKDAAEAYNTSVGWVTYHCRWWTKEHFYFYTETE